MGLFNNKIKVKVENCGLILSYLEKNGLDFNSSSDLEKRYNNEITGMANARTLNAELELGYDTENNLLIITLERAHSIDISIAYNRERITGAKYNSVSSAKFKLSDK